MTSPAPRTLLLGDTHGSAKALEQVLSRCQFRNGVDTLISIGDVVDGYPDARECVEILLGVKNLIPIVGNHDAWAATWLNFGARPYQWTLQGGLSTILSYGSGYDVPDSHRDFFNRQQRYYLDSENRLFVHGGIDPNLSIGEQSVDSIMWDRSLLRNAAARQRWADVTELPWSPLSQYAEVFVGHTEIDMEFGLSEPSTFCNVVAIDTGAGSCGVLSIMDVDTKEFWQSEYSSDLYKHTKHAKDCAKIRKRNQSGKAPSAVL